MGSIIKTEGKYRATIRRKGMKLNKTFHEKEMAELWVKYKEELIDNIENFEIPAEKLVTLEQAWDLKLESFSSRNVDKKTISDFSFSKSEFQEIMDCPLSDITSEMVRKISQKMLGNLVSKGGNKKNESSGSLRISSPSTVLRKLRVLSSVIGYMIENGANLTNPSLVVINQLKMSIIKKGEILENE